MSLPFSSLFDIRVRYNQLQFVLKQAGGTPGAYRGEDFTLSYLTGIFRTQNQAEKLAHPALDMLKQYDTEHNSELYETLYQYIQNERSVQLGAAAMHIHKNTFLYRLQKIRAVIDADLDDPLQRQLLMLSYLLER